MTKQITTKTEMDINEYLKYADDNRVYPSAKQIRMLESCMPKQSFQPGRPISDREFWDTIAASESAKVWLSNALSQLDQNKSHH